MTILCPQEFHLAVQHAIEADNALDAAVFCETDEKKQKALASRRGLAVKTLLACFGYRANSDHQDNLSPYFPDGSEVRYPNGTSRTIHDLGKDSFPLKETFIFSDFAPYSFFFRELFIDRDTRQQVEIYDRCWYVFKNDVTQAEAEALSDEELEDRIGHDGVHRIFDAKEIEKELAMNSAVVHVERMRRRVCMCGGIIYHPDYDGASPCPYGSYSTHT